MLTVGTKIQNFICETTSGENILLNSFLGKNVVLYFYPKDNTPGCILEGMQFRDFFTEFEKNNTVILGVSKDTCEKHHSFRKKYNFPFHLIADTKGEVCQYFGVLNKKKLFGKTFEGIVRSTFLIDKEGIIKKIWSPVKIKAHAEDVLKAITE